MFPIFVNDMKEQWNIASPYNFSAKENGSASRKGNIIGMNAAMKKYIFYLLFVFLAFDSLGQEKCKIRGTVTYEDEPMSGIVVLIEKDGLSSESMLTDHKGEYCFIVEHGIYKIKILSLGFF